MNKLYILPWVMLVAAMTWHSGAKAADASCEGCSSSQMASKALSLGKGNHRIYSFSTASIRGYSVTCAGSIPLVNAPPPEASRSDPGMDDDGSLFGTGSSCPLGRPLQVDNAPLDSATQTAWVLAYDFYIANGHKMSDISVNLVGSEAGGAYLDSVYPMLSDYQARQDLSNHVEDNVSLFTRYTSALAAGIIARLGILPNQIVIQVTFKDGSKVQLLYDAGTRQLNRIPNTAKLPNGQAAIEQNEAEYQGTYNTNLMDQESYFDYLRSMGVSITNGSSPGLRLKCTWNGERLSCTVFNL